MNQWEKDFTTIKLIVRAIYGSVFIYAILVYFRIPSIPQLWEQTYQIIFFALLAAALPMFPAAVLVGRHLIGTEKLTEKFRAVGGEERGLEAIIASVRTGAIVMAAMGEACAIYGLVLYFLSGNYTFPFIFFALSAIHYPVTMTRLNKAREDIEKLSRSY